VSAVDAVDRALSSPMTKTQLTKGLSFVIRTSFAALQEITLVFILERRDDVSRGRRPRHEKKRWVSA